MRRFAAAGDTLRPIAYWNQSTRGGRRLAETVQVLAVIRARSQTGVLYRVRTIGGSEIDIDADWFEAEQPLQRTLENMG